MELAFEAVFLLLFEFELLFALVFEFEFAFELLFEPPFELPPMALPPWALPPWPPYAVVFTVIWGGLMLPIALVMAPAAVWTP